VSNFVQRSLAAPPQALTEADANHKVVLGIGQDLMVKLESNRSTGYSWSLTESENPILTSLRKPTYKISGALPGAGGFETWTLRATKIGRETLKFEYRRPWEKKIPPAKTVLFHIAVQWPFTSIDRINRGDELIRGWAGWRDLSPKKVPHVTKNSR
jgi:predicted secreted protein